MSQTSDVIVIGAGIMGCSTAYALARRGVAVTVLEKDTVGAGGTGRSSAIIRQHYSHELTARMALHSLRVFQNFDDAVGGDCAFTETGWIAVASAVHKEGLAANVRMQRGIGIDTRLVSTDDVRELMPGLDTADVAAAAYEPEAGYADPHLTVNSYADAARRHGATILAGHPVTGIHFDREKVTGVETPAGSFDAPVVINCAGPWGARVAAMAGVQVPITSSRVQVAIFKRPKGYPTHPVVMDFIHGVYLRAETGNLTLLGRIDPGEAEDVVDPDEYAEHVDDDFVAYVGERFMKRYPPMELSEYTGGYSSLYAVTPDWHPIIDEIPEGSGCFVCSGFSGHGYKLGPTVGLMVADLVTGVSDPEFPADLFRFGRFEEGALIRGQYEYSIAG